jgi:general secretion pathway protein B
LRANPKINPKKGKKDRMSFILDQLKKSGKKRELELAIRNEAQTERKETAGTSPTDIQPASGPGIHSRVIYLLLFLAAASLSALGGFILLHGNTGSRQAPVVSTKAQVYTTVPHTAKAESAVPEPVLPVDGGTSLPTKSRPGADSEKAISAPAATIKMPVDKLKSSIPIPTAKHLNQPDSTTQKQIADPAPSEKAEPQDDAHRTPYLNELPASMKNALPPIRITSHLFRGDSRLVSINGRIMSQGVNMGEGLFLEEITPEGVVLSFRGHRFRVKAD